MHVTFETSQLYQTSLRPLQQTREYKTYKTGASHIDRRKCPRKKTMREVCRVMLYAWCFGSYMRKDLMINTVVNSTGTS